MNTAIATTLIGVLGAVLFGGLYGMFFHFMRAVNAKFESIDDKLGRLSDDIHALDTKFTAQIKDLEVRLTDKFTGQIKGLDTKLTAQLREHGERLARIEGKLGIDYPVEAA